MQQPSDARLRASWRWPTPNRPPRTRKPGRATKARKAVSRRQDQARPGARRAQVEAARRSRTKADAITRRSGPIYPATSTGRRLALARWIADRENPLTARVAVNHIWMRHFGAPLVPTVFDFGLNGKPPTHPALLDWLAVEFMDRGWSMKALHRLIVTATPTGMRSIRPGPTDPNLAIDPDEPASTGG